MVGRITSVLAVVLAIAIASPYQAAAHASLVKCNVAARAALGAAPRTLTCTFAEGVNPKGSFVRVFEATGDGAEVDLGNSAVSFSNVKQMTVGLPGLRKGAYLLMWFTVSADDGHRAGGSFPFSIK